MARPKKSATQSQVPMSLSNPDGGETTTLPKRSTRKRKEVNYKEPTERDADIKEVAAKKRKTATSPATKSKTRGNASTNSREKKSRGKEKGNVRSQNQTRTETQPRTQPRTHPRPAAPRRRNVRDDVPEYRSNGDEIRKRPYQNEPSEKFLGNMERALCQPLLFVDRHRCDMYEAPRETFTIAGNSGKDYTVQIRHVPSCTCIDFSIRRIPCKHIIYTMVQVLKVAHSSPLLYQTALTSSELQTIFDHAPAAPQIQVMDDDDDEPADPKRKPVDGEECPICYMEFAPGKEIITYCKGYCGNNVHKLCMETWLRSQRSMYGKGTCPYCRQDWIS